MITQYRPLAVRFLRRRLSSIITAKHYESNAAASSSTGLFGNPVLCEPGGFDQLNRDVEEKCSKFRSAILDPQRGDATVVALMDSMSDCICQAADTAECVRSTHPNSAYIDSATQCVLKMNQIVEQFNSDKEVYEALKASVRENHDVRPLTSTEQRVGELLLDDFEQAAVHLPSKQRGQYLAKTREAIVHEPHVHPEGSFEDCIAVHTWLPENRDTDAREWSYRAFYAYSDKQEQSLLSLLDSRSDLAQLAGFGSFAERAALGTILGSLESVEQFLHTLSDRLQVAAERERRTMRRLLALTDSDALQVYDIPYATKLRRSELCPAPLSKIAKYFSVEIFLEGISSLFTSLFNVSLQLIEHPDHSEVCEQSVFKLLVHDNDSDTCLGEIYCDIFARPGKLHDCHYTIRGGRCLPSGNYQRPIVCLSLNFNRPTSTQPSLLSVTQAENFAHELGHALHSMLGRTAFQHVTGTRCSTDLAEIPSNLMEYMLYDHRVLPQLARRYDNDRVMSNDLVNAIGASRNVFFANELLRQTMYALLDLRLHTGKPGRDFSSTTELFASLHESVYGLPIPADTAWHHRFSHLVLYGAKYYSYLVARAAASLIWQHRFYPDPTSSVTGAAYRNDFLSHGGELPPDLLFERFLGRRPTCNDLVDALIAEVDSSLDPSEQ